MSMQNNPYILLFGLFFALWLGAQSWKRRKLRRAVRDLPTRMQRMLGPEPDYAPPADGTPEEMQDYARLYRHVGRVQRVLWGAAVLWLVYVIFLVIREQVS
ncbi:hypothetical protein [Cognatishimia sp. F0-27]|uniref:hypothetical protein n=1 Tax=Cognatishimia sp. F0-27 TaxID=2816855 RepID=UPI001D0C242B|nr:hypothetical protein [Cognatishimia sp. F0-27]MCC1491093.1 hypothetical protein [Cognatishimia sp. F0-27]